MTWIAAQFLLGALAFPLSVIYVLYISTDMTIDFKAPLKTVFAFSVIHELPYKGFMIFETIAKTYCLQV